MTAARPLLFAAWALALAAPRAEAQEAWHLRADGQLWAGYEYAFVEGEDFHQLRLDRAELGVWAWHDPSEAARYGAELRGEVVRAAGPGSILGVDGDSLVARLKRGWGFGQRDLGAWRVEGRLGLIPDPWLDQMNQRYDLPELALTLGERGRLLEPSDLGAELLVGQTDGALGLRASVSNGEGLRQTEQNFGKNLAALLWVEPLAWAEVGAWRLRAQVMYRDGSQGVGSARDHRAAGALLLHGPGLQVGAEGILAWGLQDRSEREARGLGVWASARVWGPWGLAARCDHLWLDADLDDSAQQISSAAVFYDLIDHDLDPQAARMRLLLAFQDERLGANLSPVPGVTGVADNARLLLTLALALGGQPTPKTSQAPQARAPRPLLGDHP